MLFLRAMGPYRAVKEARTQSEAARCFAALLPPPPPPLADPLADLSLFDSELVAIPSRWPCVQGNSVLERCLGLAPVSLAAPVRRGKQTKLVRTVLPVIVAANEAAAKRMEHAIGTAGFRVRGHQAPTLGCTAAFGRRVGSLAFTACRYPKGRPLFPWPWRRWTVYGGEHAWALRTSGRNGNGNFGFSLSRRSFRDST